MNSQLFFSFFLIALGSSLHSAVYLDIDGIISDIKIVPEINSHSNGHHLTAVDLVEPGVWGSGQPVIIQDADFSYANLENADLTYYTFINVNFKGANLKGADFFDTYFYGYTDFQDANLSETNFSYAGVDYANFNGADLTNTNFSSFDPHDDEISVIGANLWGALFPSQYRTTQITYENFYINLGAVFEDPNEIPEPSTYTIIFSGLSLGFVLIRRKKNTNT